MAALRSGIKTVIIPQENERDLEEIDPLVRNALSFITTDHIDKILDCALDLKAIHVIGAHEVPIVPEINEKPEDNRPRLH
jgi:ATP-dependent Lon protease